MEMGYEFYIDPMIEHEDYTKCGTCWKQKLVSDVAKEFQAADKPFSLLLIHAEVDRRWRATSLFQEVNGMMRRGMGIDEVSKEMRKRGIEI